MTTTVTAMTDSVTTVTVITISPDRLDVMDVGRLAVKSAGRLDVMDAGLRLRLLLLLRQRITATKVTTTRGDGDNNCDWSDIIRHLSHSYRMCVTVVVVSSQKPLQTPHKPLGGVGSAR